MNIFGKWLKRRRGELGWTQEELAERIGIPPSAISHWESGRRKPSYDNLRLIIEVMECGANDLLQMFGFV